jgi:hypothetical protein
MLSMALRLRNMLHESSSTLCSAKDVSVSENSFVEYHYDENGEEEDFLRTLSSHCIPDPDSSFSDSKSSGVSSLYASVSSFEFFQSDDEPEQEFAKRWFGDSSESTVTNFNESASTLRSEAARKRVRFGKITVREHAVTVGCHAVTCPLQLGWEYRQSCWLNHNSYHRSKCPRRQSGIHRLSLCERRIWIANVQNISIADVRLMEQEMLVRHISGELVNNGPFSPHNFVVDTGVKTLSDVPPRQPHKRTRSSSKNWRNELL